MNTGETMRSPIGKLFYVAGVTTFCTFLGCWALLAHQETSQSTKKAASDEQFAKKAAQGGLAEVKMGELAQQKGTNEAVKKFGQRMAEDHTKAGEELKQAAMKENITLPTDLDTKDQATYDALSKLSGPAFDRAYARDMVKDHEQDIAEFKREANSGKNESIKNFAAQTLPTLEDHLKEAREMM
jgi:putative membrane protein